MKERILRIYEPGDPEYRDWEPLASDCLPANCELELTDEDLESARRYQKADEEHYRKHCAPYLEGSIFYCDKHRNPIR